METQVNQVALPLRSHTILGVCEAIGEEFGFNPVYLRMLFAASVIYSPTMADCRLSAARSRRHGCAPAVSEPGRAKDARTDEAAVPANSRSN